MPKPPPFESIDVSMCPTCVLFLANGDVPEPVNDWHWSDDPIDRTTGQRDTYATAEFPDGWHPRDIERNWPSSEGWQLIPPGGDASKEEFSWSACTCCGSTLGGTRYRGVAMRPAPTPSRVQTAPRTTPDTDRQFETADDNT